MTFGQSPEEYDKLVGDGIAFPEAVLLTPIDLSTIAAEYVVRPPNMIIHIFRKHEYYWTQTDAQGMWDILIEGFRLEGKENRLTVEFVPEVYGWCVTIEKIAAILPPKHETIVNVLSRVDERKRLALQGG